MREKCNVVACICIRRGNRTYVPQYPRLNNKCIPLISCSVLFLLIFSLSTTVYFLFPFRILNRVESRALSSRTTLRLFSTSITWKTWKTHSVRLHVSYEIGVTLTPTAFCTYAYERIATNKCNHLLNPHNYIFGCFCAGWRSETYA